MHTRVCAYARVHMSACVCVHTCVCMWVEPKSSAAPWLGPGQQLLWDPRGPWTGRRQRKASRPLGGTAANALRQKGRNINKAKGHRVCCLRHRPCVCSETGSRPSGKYSRFTPQLCQPRGARPQAQAFRSGGWGPARGSTERGLPFRGCPGTHTPHTEHWARGGGRGWGAPAQGCWSLGAPGDSIHASPRQSPAASRAAQADGQ